MRAVVYLVMIGIVIAVVFWGLQRLRATPSVTSRSAAALPPGDAIEERATLAYGPDRGAGVLRLSPSQLVFSADSGRVTAIERLDIVGVGVTHDLPDRTLAQAVLAVTAASQTWFFAVGSPEDWVGRLT